MSCFLCAYGRNRKPKTPDTPRSLIPSPDALGTCWRCRVHACTNHGARVGQFICAICEGADAVQSTIFPDALRAVAPSGGPIPKARATGETAPANLRETVGDALELIAADSHQRPGPAERLDLALPEAGSPNLVFNLSESIRQLADGATDFDARGEGLGHRDEVSVDAIGGVVRELFAEREIVISEGTIPTVTGALVISVQVAHEGNDAFADALLAPWEMSDPMLLDPVMWMVSTAVRQATMGRGVVTT